MAITFLKVVNRTLVKLRESEVTTLAGASAYPLLIAQLVNETKEEIETAWSWNSLRFSVDITTVAGTGTYSLTGMGEEFTIESILDTSGNIPLIGPSPNVYVDNLSLTTSLGGSSSTAVYADLLGIDSSGDPILRITPTPSADGTVIRIIGRTKQAYLETSTDSNTLIKLPWRPVVLGTYVKALSERGEDGGNTYDEASRAYDMALATAIGLDSRNSHINTDWYQD